jgi:cysteine desulfurase
MVVGMHKPVYLDYHATTPVDPRVLEAMLPYFGPRFGNAASRTHAYGWEAEKAVERARRQVADLAGAAPREIAFTSGATESINLALKGFLEAAGTPGGHMVTMATEHKAALDTAARLARQGYRVTLLPPRPDGLIDVDQLRSAILPETVLVSVMAANNEIGTLQPVREIGALCREMGVAFHCDGAQAFGKIPLDVEADGIDLMSMSAHKICGPKGIGALYVRRRGRRVALAAQMDGGGHEHGLRSGTLNVPGIVGLGEACAICAREMAAEAGRLTGLRDRLKTLLEAAVEGVRVNGSMEHRLPGNLNVSFPGVDGEALLMSLPDLALSTGSACSSATVEASHVLKALGSSDALARASVRFGLGRFTTSEEVEYAASRVADAVRRLREQAPGKAPGAML